MGERDVVSLEQYKNWRAQEHGIAVRDAAWQGDTEKGKVIHLKNRNREVVGSDAFNLEYDSSPTRDELKRDIISYLGEYRLQVQKYPYELVLGKDQKKEGMLMLRDKDRGEPVRYKAKRVLEERTLRKEPIGREQAEYFGLKLLEIQLAFPRLDYPQVAVEPYGVASSVLDKASEVVDSLRRAETGDTILWGSPPGPREQGYGEYGFIYYGKVNRLPHNEAHLAMHAIRVEKPTLTQYNEAFSELMQEDISHTKAEEYLALPRVVHEDISSELLDVVLKKHFSFEVDEGEEQRFSAIIASMDQMIEDFLDVMQTGTRADKIKSFFALENYALKLKREKGAIKDEKIVYLNQRKVEPVKLEDIVDEYGGRPPVVYGSCGKAGEKAQSNGLISAGASTIAGTNEKPGWHTGTCAKCGETTSVGKCNICASCVDFYFGGEEAA
jgi:hypothetical protein